MPSGRFGRFGVGFWPPGLPRLDSGFLVLRFQGEVLASWKFWGWVLASWGFLGEALAFWNLWGWILAPQRCPVTSGLPLRLARAKEAANRGSLASGADQHYEGNQFV